MGIPKPINFKTEQFTKCDDGSLIAESSELEIETGVWHEMVSVDGVVYNKGEPDITDGGGDLAGYNYSAADGSKLIIIND